MTPTLAAQFAAIAAWVGIAVLAIAFFAFLCWLRYKDVPPAPTGCELPDHVTCVRNFPANDAWLRENYPEEAAMYDAWDEEDARTGRPQYRLPRRVQPAPAGSERPAIGGVTLAGEVRS